MDTTSNGDLVASTGINDPTSLWGQGLLQTALNQGVSAADQALNQALASQTSETSASSGNGTPTVGNVVFAPAGKTNWLMVGLLVVAAYFAFRFFSRN